VKATVVRGSDLPCASQGEIIKCANSSDAVANLEQSPQVSHIRRQLVRELLGARVTLTPATCPAVTQSVPLSDPTVVVHTIGLN
jgi:hypothetical protein